MRSLAGSHCKELYAFIAASIPFGRGRSPDVVSLNSPASAANLSNCSPLRRAIKFSLPPGGRLSFGCNKSGLITEAKSAKREK